MKRSLLSLSLLFTLWSFAMVKFISGDFVVTADKDTQKTESNDLKTVQPKRITRTTAKAVKAVEAATALEIGQFPLGKDSQWYYRDNGVSLDNAGWKNVNDINAGWASGKAPLGYGDPVNTTISFGPDSNNKYITTYFYRDINVDLADMDDMVDFGIKRDDGVIVYVNGVEVTRDNMPAGAFTYTTGATATVNDADENRYFVYQVPKTAFTQGVNRIAVELHQKDGASSDLKFDMYVKNSVESLAVGCDEPHISCFTSIAPTTQTTKLIMAEEHNFQLLFKEGSAYTTPFGNITTVPGNHDYTAYLPIDGSSETGRLSVNHENGPGGVSIVNLHLNTDTTQWSVDTSVPVDLYNEHLVTTTRNCSGGNTPWGTVITAEESTAQVDNNGDGYYDEGWLVEIDPATAMVKEHGNGYQEKLWAMGRMNHENVVITNDGTKAYYGEDGTTHCVYKFVPTVANNLSAGKVYVLKLDLPLANDEPSSSTGIWIEVPNTTQADRNNLNIVAGTLGGTNFNGVEDCEISPLNGKIYFTSKGKNRIYSFKDDGASISEFETFVGGMTYPIETAGGTIMEDWRDGNDNLVFDEKGTLWLCQDGGRNYIWTIAPDHTQNNPKIKIFASMPAGSEPTGLTFTPDHKYGFFSVQHPNGTNEPQADASGAQVNFNASAVVVFALDSNIGLQKPVADFSASDVQVNEGETVTFTDLSTHLPTGWAWTFEGGTPATSTEAAPVVTYAEAGTYAVSLVSTNAAGNSDAANKPAYIVVEEVAGLDDLHTLKSATVYPNPTSGLVNVQFNEEGGQNIQLEVYDFLGRKVYETTGVTTGGEQKLEVNVAKLIGDQVFFIKLNVGDKSANYKLLKN
jgi:secreted PhoX family phosphatase